MYYDVVVSIYDESGKNDDGTHSLTCGVKGCYNGNSFDGWLDINECRLKESD